MRFPVENPRHPRGPRLAALCLALLSSTALAVCAQARDVPASVALPANGPQADYPLTIGEPYTIGEVTYRPADTLNYDEVGYATAGAGNGITGAHHTLPVPCYVEVTSLETGRTILVRLETRGPMDSNHLVALSPAAMAQLGATADTPVRVRRVNPPESQRALLRAGEEAPLRMDTPRGLVEVLRRRLPANGSASLAGGVQPVGSVPPSVVAPAVEPVEPAPALAPLATSALTVPTAIENVSVEPSSVADAFALTPAADEPAEPASVVIAEAQPEPAPAPAPVAAPVPSTGGWVVQAGAYSVAANAQRVASQINGRVSHSGNLYRVRTGPFGSRAEAEASLANVRAAGYSDARIYNGG
ncbi:SPOR domain-containing protein [Alteraurantiacibacter buctensis]|uniref:Sporulation protein SsgA n=1 Tax=Alteraurantiacibacter buctensis TaxID=1503981 RepID=A0A844Z0C9_9SPHN|nr:SPOR domain-containing protein [Alteraurantiacibacter buctensis]MXO72164.1 sporulation protein SsgA [Alteraurantiacibacter buctensis]